MHAKDYCDEHVAKAAEMIEQSSEKNCVFNLSAWLLMPVARYLRCSHQTKLQSYNAIHFGPGTCCEAHSLQMN